MTNDGAGVRDAARQELDGPCPHNRWLERLPAETQQRWGPALEDVVLRSGTVLHPGQGAVGWVYFPTTCVIGLSLRPPDGPMVALRLVGNATMFGIGALLGDAAVDVCAEVLVPGRARRLPAGALKREFDRGGEAAQLMLAAVRLHITAVSRAAYCHRHHELMQQLCARLVQLHDRSRSAALALTQLQLAGLIGARRERVNLLVNQLREQGAVALGRGGLQVLRRDALHRRACGCLEAIDEAERHALRGRG